MYVAGDAQLVREIVQEADVLVLLFDPIGSDKTACIFEAAGLVGVAELRQPLMDALVIHTTSTMNDRHHHHQHCGDHHYHRVQVTKVVPMISSIVRVPPISRSSWNRWCSPWNLWCSPWNRWYSPWNPGCGNEDVAVEKNGLVSIAYS
jgi:hypothetical protein